MQRAIKWARMRSRICACSEILNRQCNQLPAALEISRNLVLAPHMLQNAYSMRFSGYIVHFWGEMCSLKAREAATSAWTACAWHIHSTNLLLNQCISSTTTRCQKGAKTGCFYLCFCHTKMLRGSRVLIFASLESASSKRLKERLFGQPPAFMRGTKK